MTRKYITWYLLFTIAALIIGLVGCKDTDTSTDPVDEEDPIVLPTSADEMVATYSEAWRSQDLAAYDAIMSTDFKFVLLTETVMEIGADKDYLARNEDLESTENLFEAVSEIEMILNGQGQWEIEDDTHEHFSGLLRRTYNMHAEIFDPNSGTRYIVDGLVTFYATSLDSVVNGEQVTYWYLAGQHDHTHAKATVNETFGGIKTLFS